LVASARIPLQPRLELELRRLEFLPNVSHIE
jgi:hypothetical protein